jgi:hypothetical protein
MLKKTVGQAGWASDLRGPAICVHQKTDSGPFRRVSRFRSGCYSLRGDPLGRYRLRFAKTHIRTVWPCPSVEFSAFDPPVNGFAHRVIRPRSTWPVGSFHVYHRRKRKQTRRGTEAGIIPNRSAIYRHRRAAVRGALVTLKALADRLGAAVV